MVKDYPLGIGGHKFTKKNLVTKTGPKGMYDEYECELCGMKGRSYKLGTIQISASYGKNIFKCKNLKPTKRIKITRCHGFGSEFANLTPGSIHTIVEPPKFGEKCKGVWVEGVSEKVLVLFDEFVYID